MANRDESEWLAADGHVGTVALGVPAVRDAVNPPVSLEQNVLVQSVVLSQGQQINAENEWLQVLPFDMFTGQFGRDLGLVPLNFDPQGASGGISVGLEPFFVSGRKTFFVGSTRVIVQRAPRREMLSTPTPLIAPSNGVGQRELTGFTGFTFGPLSLPNSDWAYLYQAGGAGGPLGIRITPIGTIQAGDSLPFGWDAPDPNFRGRYYNIEFATTATSAHSVGIFHDYGANLYTGPAISRQLNNCLGHCQVGDDVSTNIAGPTFFSGLYSQQQCLGSRSWTLVIRGATTVSSFSGRFNVTWRGF